MQSNAVRILGGAAAVALAVVLLVVLKDEGEKSSDSGSMASSAVTSKAPEEKNPGNKATEQPAREKPAVPTIVVGNGKPVGGVAELSYEAGEDVLFKVRSDVSDELHLHGYDISKEVEAGGSVEFHFKAEIEGVFELELEQRAEPIAELQVNP